MSSLTVFLIISCYFLMLIVTSLYTGRKSDSLTFFTANKKSSWYLVAFGTIGTSLSGVTFISVPGEVGNSQFSYFQMALGFLLGYFIIGAVLLPLYYRLKLISIYSYLEGRFGFWSFKTGALIFMISRIIGASLRLFLVASVLHLGFFEKFDVPFWVTVSVAISLIWLYTFQGGIKTIVLTDALQTFFMILAVFVTIYMIKQDLNLSFTGLVETVNESSYSKTFFWDGSKNNFFKQFFAGAFIVISMIGLDQSMMQKHLTCASLKDAQKNIFWFSIAVVIVLFLFIGLGALLHIFAAQKGIETPESTDQLYPILALNHLSSFTGAIFLLGIIAAAYSSADSALTSLTTSFCFDFLNFKKDEKYDKKVRLIVHLGFSILIFLVILVFRAFNDESVVSAIYKVSGYTYGPLVGLFAFGLFSKIQIKDKWTPLICLLSPGVSYIININAVSWFGYTFGFELLIVNALFTFIGLWWIRSD